MIHTPSDPWRLLLACALTAVSLTSPSQAQVDLEARSVEGPGKAHVGRPVLVRVDIASLGTPPIGPYTARVVISEDELLDPGDLIVATIRDTTFGPRGVVADIPDLPANTTVYFGLLVEPMPGETSTSNNRRLGPPCSLIRTDLQLDDPAPVELLVRTPKPEPESLITTVSNVGTSDSVLVFTIEKLAIADWLTLEPPSGFAVGGRPGQPITLRFHHFGLAVGSYQTTLRFRNFVAPDDFQDLPVTLSVGEAQFVPGDRIVGDLDRGDVDLVEFSGLAGMLLTVRARTTLGNLRPRVEVLNPEGRRESVLRFDHSSRSTRKAVRLKRSGDYQLRISGRAGSGGGYKLWTGRKLTGKARPRTIRLRPKTASTSAATAVLLLPGSELEFWVKPNARFSGPLGLLFETPAGSLYDLAGFASPGPDGSLVVSGIPITQGGRYVLRITGFGAQVGETVQLALLPTQPPPGGEQIYLK